MNAFQQTHWAKLTAALDTSRAAAPPPRPMTPVEVCVTNILWCMTADKETFGQAVAIVLGTLAAGDPQPYQVIYAASQVAVGIVTGEGIERE